MKKKILLIFFIILIVIFLIIFFFKEDNIFNDASNNTLNKLKKDEYKMVLRLDSKYTNYNKELSTTIKYKEYRKDNLYKYINELYENNTKLKTTINYAVKEKDSYTFYRYKNNKYVKTNVKDISKEKDINIDLKKFLNKIKYINKYKTKNNIVYYKTKMSYEDAFSLIYKDSSSNIDKNVDVYIEVFNNNIKNIKFELKDKEIYDLNLSIDFSIQNIKLDIN